MDRPLFTDLHSHLVPGVDDGSATVEESLASLAALRAEGIGALITTPHLLLPRLATEADLDRELAVHRAAFDELAEAVRGRDDLPAIGLGQEIWAPDGYQIRRVVGRTDVGYDGGHYLLVEFGFDLQGTHEDVVQEAVAGGRGIVVAHVERYRYLPGVEPLEQMRRWRELGALLQVNAGSFNGYYDRSNPGAERLAWAMVEERLVDIVSTDHHGSRRAGVSLLEAFEALAARGERELAERVLAGAPDQVARVALNGTLKPVSSPPAAGSSRSP
ncbi:MAG TPA: CpsB/CapC family capsule biosynthesis tyrosine phosphatase [Gemmatimonadales bacterium]|nr:CpsB/CapC family capsule biosynthesis tyrosine phosphatase [Gemmatimonadales bacterium]